MTRFIIAVVLAASMCGVAYGESTVTVHAKGEAAEKVFADIMKQTGKNFIYSPEVLKGVKITAEANGMPLADALRRIFSGTGVEFRIKGNNVLLTRRQQRAENVHKLWRVSGFVREEETGEPMAGVVVSSGKDGVTTNVYGFYSLQLPAGETRIDVSAFGYNSASTSTFNLSSDRTVDFTLTPVKMLDEVVVTSSRNRVDAIDATSVGSLSLSSEKIRYTPVIFGESDIIKTLQLEPGVTPGVEGFAGMYVHGGNHDENLYMLDNIPLYQVNHLGGLFSAFNSEIMRNVDFYKSSFPARYDGRLSSFMDVHTKDGSTEKANGSFTLGLICGAFDINGPIGKNKKTTYSIGLRRTWLDVLTAPLIAILNTNVAKEDKIKARYALSDLNAKITHRFSDRTKGWLTVYYGEDFLLGGTDGNYEWQNRYEKDNITNRLYWGNIVASAGLNRVFSPRLFGDFTFAYTRYFSQLKSEEEYSEKVDGILESYSRDFRQSKNYIDDWIARADFDWRPTGAHRVNFGASMTLHSFLPENLRKESETIGASSSMTRNSGRFHAVEANAYIGDDWRISEKWRGDAGIHLSLFHIDGKTHTGVSPRLSVRYNPAANWAIKGSYSRTVQYVHQLSKSFISLPTDQWMPITGNMKPQTADKVALGVYWTPNDKLTVSAEGFLKKMRNIVDYSDLYYVADNRAGWDSKLCSGSGNAKGIDFKVSREFGKLTGHVSYSLLWADRKFAGKNQGRPFPARFDNRHKINVTLNWKINSRWDINASWTGMSGNRFTLAVQDWNAPNLSEWISLEYGGNYMVGDTEVPYIKDLNNYRLPFYHRLDLSVVRQTKRGYWTISIFNAYCNLNTVAIRQAYNDNGERVFQKVGIMPFIPSFSYTWKF